jgi:hypothetical protein
MDDFGELVSAKDIALENVVPGDNGFVEPYDLASTDNALWNYKIEHRINGILVRESDRGLPVEVDHLPVAFRLTSTPKCAVMWLIPDVPESADKYNALLMKAYNNEIAIESEERHYDPTKQAFAVFVRYTELMYELHPRFNHLREERIHGK